MGLVHLKWTTEQIFEFLDREFPQAFRDGRHYEVMMLEPGRASVRLTADERRLRPGGTVSGPAMMELVDFSVYVLLLAHHGREARLAVTTNLQISFLRKPAPGDIVADVELIKHGRTLTVAAVRIRSAANGKLVASSEATYFMGGEG